jgi:hypothetical protein
MYILIHLHKINAMTEHTYISLIYSEEKSVIASVQVCISLFYQLIMFGIGLWTTVLIFEEYSSIITINQLTQ